MATLKKVKTVVWEDANGNRVKAGTLGAAKRTITSANWYIVTKENGKVKRIPTVPDKAAAHAMLGDFIRNKAHGKANMIDPYKKYYDRPILDHVADYHSYVAAHSRSEKHTSEVLRVLKAVIAGTKWESIRDISSGTLATYLTTMRRRTRKGDAGPAAAGTKNMHRRIAVMFGNWLETNARLPNNPIGGKKVKTFKAKKADKRRRRAMTADELQRLLVAARDQPLKDVGTSRGGRPRQDGSPARPGHPVKLTQETIKKKIMEGRERQLLYRVAISTGLRRAELSRLQIAHLNLDHGMPKINMPGELTKNGDPANIPLVPTLAADLKAWITETKKNYHDPVFHVPCASNLTHIHQRLLKAAGILYQDQEGKYADFHSLRKAANVMLRQAGIALKDRMAFLRHGSAQLTDGVYEDEAMTATNKIMDAFRNTGL